MTVFIFDLDDTLYNEKNYVHSGFNAVAEFLSIAYGFDKKTLKKDLQNELNRNGRGNIFNMVLEKRNIHSLQLVKKCIAVYRAHKPKLRLPATSINCLNRLKKYPLYVVTDGNRIVQRNKVNALGLAKYVDGILITHDHGIANAKPSLYCFEKIREKEKADYKDMVYIGDNPQKDFVNIKRSGYKTVRVLQGDYKDLVVSKEKDAHIHIKSLAELDPELINKIV